MHTGDLFSVPSFSEARYASHGLRCGRRYAVVVALLFSIAVGASPSRADDLSKDDAPKRVAVPPLVGATAVTNLVVATPVAPIRTSVRAVELAETPSAAVVVRSSPLLEKPAAAALAEISAKAPSSALDSRMNRETLQSSLELGDRMYTPEQAGSALRYLRRKPSWRGLLNLFDPAAPVVTPDLPAATAFETRRGLGVPPRAFRDASTHEPELRLY